MLAGTTLSNRFKNLALTPQILVFTKDYLERLQPRLLKAKMKRNSEVDGNGYKESLWKRQWWVSKNPETLGEKNNFISSSACSD